MLLKAPQWHKDVRRKVKLTLRRELYRALVLTSLALAFRNPWRRRTRMRRGPILP